MAENLETARCKIVVISTADEKSLVELEFLPKNAVIIAQGTSLDELLKNGGDRLTEVEKCSRLKFHS